MNTSAIRDAALRCRALLMDRLRTAGSSTAVSSPDARQAAATALLRVAAGRMLRTRGLDRRPLDALLPCDESARLRSIFPKTDGRIGEVLDEPALAELWSPGKEEAIGWLYQYFNEPDIEVFRGTRPPKVTAETLAPKTQLFTPQWIVRFLVENTLGHLWSCMHPDSRLQAELGYLVLREPAPVLGRPKLVTGIRVLDPACGTMHFGLAVFDLLATMYREELDQAGRPGWPACPSVASESGIASAILTNNLFGFDIDPMAVRLSRLILYLKAAGAGHGHPAIPANMHCADVLSDYGLGLRDDSSESTEGADAALRSNYDVVVTNPPYLDSRDYDACLKSFMPTAYPAGKRNLYGAFLERSLSFLGEGGLLGMVTPQTFMFISSFAELREVLRKNVVIETLVQAGLGTFPDAVVDAAFYVFRREHHQDRRDAAVGRYFRLTGPPDTKAKRVAFEEACGALRRSRLHPDTCAFRQGDFDLLPGRPWVYWVTPPVRDLFRTLPRLKEVARPVVGLQTSDNSRFLRFWWEMYFRDEPDAPCSDNRYIAFGCADRSLALATGRKWFPHIKGGGFRRWYGNQEYVVNWANDGAEIRSLGIESGKVASRPQNMEFYFRPGVTWTHTSSRGLSVRILPPGFICNVEGIAAFQKDGKGSPLETLAIMNSSFARHVIDLLNPTVHFGGREVGDLPYPRAEPAAVRRLELLVEEAIELSRCDSREDETTYDFVAPPDWSAAGAELARHRSRLADVERRIDDEVYRLYGLGPEDRFAIEADLHRGHREKPGDSDVLDRRDLAHRWISYAVGVALGRFRPGRPESLGRGRFDDGAAGRMRAMSVPGGIGELREDEEEDLAARVMAVLRLMLGDQGAEEIVRAISGRARDGSTGLRAYLVQGFFRQHCRQYRNRPIYWLLQSPKRTRSVYVYYECLSATALRGLNDASTSRSGTADALLSHALAGEPPVPPGCQRQDAHKRIADLKAFDAALDRVLEALDERGRSVGWQLEPDDGVLVNLAPLHELVPAWFAEPAACWRKLVVGDYDWSLTARRYWPNRVLDKCRSDKSLALAHGRMDVYQGTLR